MCVCVCGCVFVCVGVCVGAFTCMLRSGKNSDQRNDSNKPSTPPKVSKNPQRVNVWIHFFSHPQTREDVSTNLYILVTYWLHTGPGQLSVIFSEPRLAEYLVLFSRLLFAGSPVSPPSFSLLLVCFWFSLWSVAADAFKFDLTSLKC